MVRRRKPTDPNNDTAPLVDPNFDPDAVGVTENLDATFRVSSGQYAQYVKDLSSSFRREIEQQRAELAEHDPKLRSNTNSSTSGPTAANSVWYIALIGPAASADR